MEFRFLPKSLKWRPVAASSSCKEFYTLFEYGKQFRGLLTLNPWVFERRICFYFWHWIYVHILKLLLSNGFMDEHSDDFRHCHDERNARQDGKTISATTVSEWKKDEVLCLLKDLGAAVLVRACDRMFDDKEQRGLELSFELRKYLQQNQW